MRNSPNQLKNLEKGVSYRFTSETAGEAGRKGNPASQASRKRNRSMAQLARQVADSVVSSGDAREDLRELGLRDEDLYNASLIVAGVFRNAAAGNIPAVEKWEEFLERAAAEENGALDQEQARALSIMRANYLPNISSNFGAISVCALKHRYTHYEVSGGRGSLKSSWASQTVIRLIMENPDTHALVLRKVANTMRDSVYAQYIWAIGILGVSSFWEARRSPLELIYLPTGQRILFRGADDPMKIKSIKVPFGYIAITHFEEKDQFAGRQEIDTILQSTMRGGEVFWNIETYNPPLSRDNWANKDSEEERSDRIRHRSSYLDLDNPSWLGEQFIAEAEELKRRDTRRYQHEYLGLAVGSGGNVFDNLDFRPITDEELRSFDRIYMGADWGWFPDPFAFVRLHYDPAQETIYLLDELYANNMTNEETAKWILSHGYNDAQITCDSAEPKSVADYRSQGLPAKPAVKGPGSIDYGMKWLQGRKIVIDKRRTPHAAEEFSLYEYDRDRSGNFVSGYPDRNNHLIDATRYALERIIRNYRSNA
ncbi:MAG: PBSX family phage terminase large subunit [Oscillospiraceae bacterium]|nr:PBSX family phage terminase large subunit [Oscillospiraceae bacterium]